MKRSEGLEGLVRLQQLRERRQRAAAERAGAAHRKSDEAYGLCLRSEEAAYAAFASLHSSLPFELDHLQLLGAHLTHAADRRLEAAEARARSGDDHRVALNSLEVEIARTRKLADQALKARRRAAAKEDEINLRTMRSLHAAPGERRAK
jgi:hypothetical protein